MHFYCPKYEFDLKKKKAGQKFKIFASEKWPMKSLTTCFKARYIVDTNNIKGLVFKIK